MPPYVPRKRKHSPSPAVNGTSKAKSNSQGNIAITAPPRKPTLFDDLDASSTPHSSTRNGSMKQLIEDNQDNDDSSLTSLSDHDFEDVPPAKRPKQSPHSADDDDDDDDDDEDIEFEDVDHAHVPRSAVPNVPATDGEELELTLTRDTRINLANALGKKGPTKTERKIRIATHCVHVQLLMWHNAVRNSWLCDVEVQGLLLSHLPPRLWDEVDRWRRNSGLEIQKEEQPVSKKKGAKGKDKGRDWGEAAQRLEQGAVDMSHGDPLFRLMKALASWWKQRFRIKAPGLRKVGYMSLERLDQLTKAFKQGPHDPERFGERIRDLEEFRRCAVECSGSRDVGAQLFTALLRGLGLEARLVANIQPLGFGWNKLEDAEPEKEGKQGTNLSRASQTAETPADDSLAPQETSRVRSSRQRARKQVQREDLSDLSLVADADSDEELAIEPIQPLPRRAKVYDADLEFPQYWTEVLSPVTKKYLAVDPIVKFVIATNRELVESFEPRGSKADRARQVMAYVVAHSADGTAKDVTVRYLKRHVWPGRTKGARMPVEKIPVYNRHGKVKRYDMHDWFKSVMRSYVRGGNKKHPITEIDELEDSTDLKPAKADKKEVKEGEETLQYYKQSKEFVLEQHLKREEALLPGAKPVRMFKNKGKGVQAQEEPVYSRKDVVQVKSAETWHKQGRAPIAGEQPLKRVPYRAATTNRRREIAEAEAATGAKVLQGLYSFDQTDWIIPPPIRDGIIPKNEYGNIDLFVEHMCPEGAVHVPYRGAMRVCKRLGIDYAEAVVDFEFGHRMAVPVIQGVVVAEEYHDQVMEELAKDEAERSRKEDEKRRKAALAMWRKFMMGMRIIERIKQDHGDVPDDVNVFGRGGRTDRMNSEEDNLQTSHSAETADVGEMEVDMAGGFFREGFDVEAGETAQLTSAFFPVVDEEDADDQEDILEVDHGEAATTATAAGTSAMSTRPKRKATSKASASERRRRRRQNSPSEDEDDYDRAAEGD